MIIDEIQPPAPWPDVEDEDETLEGTALDISEEGLDEMVNIIRNLETTAGHGIFEGPEEEEEEVYRDRTHLGPLWRPPGSILAPWGPLLGPLGRSRGPFLALLEPPKQVLSR